MEINFELISADRRKVEIILRSKKLKNKTFNFYDVFCCVHQDGAQ
jgi:hypothetical protein